jgi:hypothetical protein
MPAHGRDEPEKNAEENDAGNKEDPHLLSPSEVSPFHRLPDDT